MRGLTVTQQLELTSQTCCSCGVLFAMPTELYAARVADKRTFYCPNGHAQYYIEGSSNAPTSAEH